MTSDDHPTPPETTLSASPSFSLGDGLAVMRHHIVLIAIAASLVFGWLMTGQYLVAIALLVGIDWFLINLMNRITDVSEDSRNGIRGTSFVARHVRGLTIFSAVIMGGSFVVSHVTTPELTWVRILVQLIGLGYNYSIVPTHRGFARFKEIYFLKNFMSAMLFVLTCFVYAIVTHEDALIMNSPAIVALICFFVPYELTFEILYDLRDLEGDRAEGVPTYPVVHGGARARDIVDALLLGSSLVLLGAFGWGDLGLRELLMIVAPLGMFVLVRTRYREELRPRDCVLLTHIGTAELAIYLLGTALWSAAGLPANIYLTG